MRGRSAALFGPIFQMAAQASLTALYQPLFALFDRDRSGFADEADVIAVLKSRLGSEKGAEDALARVTASGQITASQLQALLEATLPDAPEAVRHQQTVRLLLAVVKDFEQRATLRGEFALAAEAQDCANSLRSIEEQRALFVMQQQQQRELEVLVQQHDTDASRFNQAWKQRMDEFSNLASRAVEEMRARHENSVEDFLSTHRSNLVEHFRRHAKDKDTLDSERVLHRLAKSHEYAACEEYAKQVHGKVRKDHEAAAGRAEEELQRRLEVHRWHMRRELKGLVTKCERIRAEHRGQWEDGLAKLILAQKNKVADVRARHMREGTRAQQVIRAALEPSLPPVQRVEAHQNLALLSPRSTAKSGQWPPPVVAPMQRPSRMASPRVVRPNLLAPCPPRPYTSEHRPRFEPERVRSAPGSAR